MIIQILGWLSTALVLVGYFLNSQQKVKLAMITWITGDIGWIIYDIGINNLSHAVLSFVIIGLNIYGIINILRNNKINKSVWP